MGGLCRGISDWGIQIISLRFLSSRIALGSGSPIPSGLSDPRREAEIGKLVEIVELWVAFCLGIFDWGIQIISLGSLSLRMALGSGSPIPSGLSDPRREAEIGKLVEMAELWVGFFRGIFDWGIQIISLGFLALRMALCSGSPIPSGLSDPRREAEIGKLVEMAELREASVVAFSIGAY